MDDLARLRRFLVLGSEGGSYYASERKLTLENAQAVRRCIDSGGPAAVGEIVAVSEERRAPRVGPGPVRPGPGRVPRRRRDQGAGL